MSNIITANVVVRGVKPLFQSWFGPDALPLEKVEKTGKAGNDPTEWRRSTLVTDEGQLYVLGTYIFSTVKNGAYYTKRGRGSIMNNVAATLEVVEDRVMIDRWFPGFPNGHKFNIDSVEEPPRDATKPLYLDVRGVLNPATKARNVRYRVVCNTGWTCEFNIQWDKTIVSRTEMEASIIDAGRLVGLANARKIGMGRFVVDRFSVSE